MENLIRRRTHLRTTFTKLYKNLTVMLEDENIKMEEIEGKFASLQRINSSLEIVDDEVLELIPREDETDKYGEEFETIEEYREKFDMIQVRMKSLSQLIEQQCLNNERSEKTKLKLPELEFAKFGGEIKEWLTFWSQFSRIHEDENMAQEDKFQYLVQYMTPGSRAKELIDSYPPTAENYGKAVESLKARFGREELLIEFYVRELLGLVIKNAVNARSKTNVTQLYDKLESHLRSLESIGMTSDKYAAMLFPLVESCIPEDTLRAWLRNPRISEKNTYGDKLTQLLLFLRLEVEGEERISLAKTGIKQSENTARKARVKEDEYLIPTANDLPVSTKEPTKYQNCVFCGKSHQSRDCYQGQKLTFEEKMDILSKNKRCFSCFKGGHRSRFCRSNIHCNICGKRHFEILCPEVKLKKKVTSTNKNERLENNTLFSTDLTEGVLLQTLLVLIKSDERKRIVRALLDTGSQRSYILKSTAERLGLKSTGSQSLKHVVFGGTTSFEEHKCYRINIKNLQTEFSCDIAVLDQRNICGTIPRIQNGLWTNQLKERGIVISDVGKGTPLIELLIGADSVGEIYTGRIQHLETGLTAVETHLGWVLMGSPEAKTEQRHMDITTISGLIHDDNITSLWKLDTIGIKDPYEQQNQREIDNAVKEHFLETVKLNEEGRYEVELPWKEIKELPDNRIIAEKRLEKTIGKLLAEGKYEEYGSVLKQWLNENIIEEVPSAELSNPSCYLPHRGVFKTNSTTNVRPVFDASCKQKGCLSLNDCLEKGPNTLQLIPEILIRFRWKEIGVIADIKRAFLQISVNKRDRDYLRFLWKMMENQEIKVFRHKRVVFGVNCSPFILGAVIQHHLEISSSSSKHVIRKLKNSFYVDNCVTSVDSMDELNDFIENSTKIMAEAKLELRGWEYNKIEDSLQGTKHSSVLGLLWDKQEDELFCNVSELKMPGGPLTRRTLLSVAQKIFDPIGFSSPATLLPKLLLQESWKSRLRWDDEIPETLAKRFKTWCDELPLLTQVKIPRRITSSKCTSMSLHTYCDASGASYATVVYLRCETDKQVTVQLLLAKSRIAPIKKITIPRLELLACTLGARLTDFVKGILDFQDVRVHFWTDSVTALQWIKRNEPWGVFVQNRVKEIRRLSAIKDWKHIPGVFNPADLPSRGCTIKKLIESRWWEGPSWLKKNEKDWPISKPLHNETEIFQERVETVLVSTQETTETTWLSSYFSKYGKIVRMVGWIMRYLHNSQKRKERLCGELTAKELNESEKKIIKLVQQESFNREHLNELKSLFIFIDNAGIFRVKTKLTEREDMEDFKYPMLLPSKHKIVELLILERHISLSHVGLHPLLMSLRENLWIIQGRRTVRRVISRCVRCKRHNVKSLQTNPVALPKDRVRDASVFEVVGVDLAGPLILTGGIKSWIVLYTCAVFRAVHLELITSLSTKAFLLSFRRFIARRGRPDTVYSDNGTNFVGTNNLLKTIDWEVIQKEACVKRITWKFNPPTAAWWGGFWERLIQMVKRLLRRVLGNASLNYEEMISLLCDCEAIVNSRPLTYISENTEDLQPLTPAMFIQDIQTVGVPDMDNLDRIDLSKRLQYQQKLRDILRKRFRTEYLGQLILRRPKENVNMLKIGDVVLIEQEEKKRTFWPMGRITCLYPGKDGQCRVARVKTSNGGVIRPIKHLYPLEIDLSDCKKKEASTEVCDQKENSFNETLQEKMISRRKRTIDKY